jgi:hypothetical protein
MEKATTGPVEKATEGCSGGQGGPRKAGGRGGQEAPCRGGRWAAALGCGGDMPVVMKNTEVAWRCTIVVLRWTTFCRGQVDFGEDEWIKGYDVGPLGWCRPTNGGVRSDA